MGSVKDGLKPTQTVLQEAVHCCDRYCEEDLAIDTLLNILSDDHSGTETWPTSHPTEARPSRTRRRGSIKPYRRNVRLELKYGAAVAALYLIKHIQAHIHPHIIMYTETYMCTPKPHLIDIHVLKYIHSENFICSYMYTKTDTHILCEIHT